MVDSIGMAIFGSAVFCVRVVRREALLRACDENKIRMYQVRYQSALEFCCVVRRRDIEKFLSICENYGASAKLVSRKGILPKMMREFSRAGMVVGAVLFLATALISAQFIWQIEITGASNYEKTVVQQLNAMGIRQGTPWRSVDLDAITTSLMVQNEFAAYVIVKRQGICLQVQIVPAIEPEPMIDQGEPCHIVAAQSGQITKIVAYEGIPMVKEGDIVQKGDILISGLREFSEGGERRVHARGTVQGISWVQSTAVAPISETLVEYTGESVVASYLQFGSWKIELETPPEDLSMYQLTKTEKTPVVGLFFPVDYTVQTYEKITLTSSKRAYEEAEAQAAAQAEKLALRQVPIGARVVEKQISSEWVQDGIKTQVVLAVEREMGVEAEMTEPFPTASPNN